MRTKWKKIARFGVPSGLVLWAAKMIAPPFVPYAILITFSILYAFMLWGIYESRLARCIVVMVALGLVCWFGSGAYKSLTDSPLAKRDDLAGLATKQDLAHAEEVIIDEIKRQYEDVRMPTPFPSALRQAGSSVELEIGNVSLSLTLGDKRKDNLTGTEMYELVVHRLVVVKDPASGRSARYENNTFLIDADKPFALVTGREHALVFRVLKSSSGKEVPWVGFLPNSEVPASLRSFYNTSARLF